MKRTHVETGRCYENWRGKYKLDKEMLTRTPTYYIYRSEEKADATLSRFGKMMTSAMVVTFAQSHKFATLFAALSPFENCQNVKMRGSRQNESSQTLLATTE